MQAVEKALEQIETIIAEINERKRSDDNAANILRIQKRLADVRTPTTTMEVPKK
jgi:hypothetical protein